MPFDQGYWVWSAWWGPTPVYRFGIAGNAAKTRKANWANPFKVKRRLFKLKRWFNVKRRFKFIFLDGNTSVASPSPSCYIQI